MNKPDNHICTVIVPRSTDWFQGDNNIAFKAVLPSADWTPYFHFNERQRYAWDDEGCVCFAAQKIFDAQVDYLIASGKIEPTAT